MLTKQTVLSGNSLWNRLCSGYIWFYATPFSQRFIGNWENNPLAKSWHIKVLFDISLQIYHLAYFIIAIKMLITVFFKWPWTWKRARKDKHNGLEGGNGIKNDVILFSTQK